MIIRESGFLSLKLCDLAWSKSERLRLNLKTQRLTETGKGDGPKQKVPRQN